MSHETLFVERAGAILTVTLNRPKQLNAINRVMAQELDDLARSLEADRAVHVVIITGAGDRAFLAGADITEFQPRRKKAVLLAGASPAWGIVGAPQ